MDEETWCMELNFDEDPSQSFASGFEAGQIYVLLGAAQSEVKQLVHSNNVPLLNRMAGIKGYNLHTEASDSDGWSYAIFTKTRPARHLYEVKRPDAREGLSPEEKDFLDWHKD